MMAAVEKKNWLAKNWVWAVPTGVVIVVAVGAVVLSPFYLGSAASIRKTSAYKEAIRRVALNPKVRQQLGDPIEAEGEVEGNLQITGQRGFADFTIPVTGPKGKGTISVEAMLIGGTWQYRHLSLKAEGSSKEIVVEGQQPVIDLSPKKDEPATKDSPQGQTPEIPTGQPTGPGPPQGRPQPEPSKPENPKSDPPKADPPKADPPKADPPKADPPKTESPKTESPPADPPEKQETSTAEALKESP